MFVVFLRFGPNRQQAGQWMAGHNQWIRQGIDDGVFLLAGSLEGGQGGALLANVAERATLLERLERDPFVEHGVVAAEVHAISPSRVAPGLEALLAGAPAVPDIAAHPR